MFCLCQPVKRFNAQNEYPITIITMKTISPLVKCAAVLALASFGAAYSHAEKVYLHTDSDTWQFYNDSALYKNEQGQAVTPDWETSDVYIDMANLHEDYAKGITGDWKVKSLTFVDGQGKFGHYWWDQQNSGSNPALGKTLEITESLNMYNAVENDAAKQFHLKVKDFNISVTNGQSSSAVKMRGTRTLDIQNLKIDNGSINTGAVFFNETGYKDGGEYKGGVNIADIDAKNMGTLLFNHSYGVIIGNLTTTNMAWVDMTNIGNVAFGEGEAHESTGRGIEFTGNVLINGGGINGSSSVYFKSANGISGTGGLVFTEVGNLDGGTGNARIFTGGVDIGGSLEMGGQINSERAGYFNVEGDVISNAGEINLSNTGRIGGGTNSNDQVVGGIDIGGSLKALGNRIHFINSAYVKINGDLVMRNMQGTSQWDNVGKNNDGTFISANHGINIGGDFIADNGGFAHQSIQSSGSNYVDVKGKVSLNNANWYSWNVNYIHIGGALETTGSCAILFDGVNDVQIGRTQGGGFSLNANFEARETGHIAINGDFVLGESANAMVSAYKGSDFNAATADNAGLAVSGKIRMSSTDTNRAQLGAYFYCDSSNPSKYDKNLYVSSKGLDGNGNIYLTKEKIADADRGQGGFAVTHVLDVSEDSSFRAQIWQLYHDGDLGKMKLNIVKNGAANQTLIIDNTASQWHGKITVNSGGFFLAAGDSVVVAEGVAAAPTMLVDVDVKSGAVFGNVEGQDAYINILSVDGGALVAGGTGTVFVKDGMEILSGGLVVSYTGEGSEGLVVTDFLAWDNAIDADIRLVLDAAFAANKVVLKDSSGKQYAVEGYSLDNNKLSVTYGAVPEPAAVAALFGAVAMGFVLLRRRRK